jgi:hypothetical protein
MRIYIIANDGITLCREAPAAMTEGEIAVTSKEELHAAPLNAKRLLALWNALPGVEKRRKVGDRAALINQLWTAIEALPEPEPQSEVKQSSKQGAVIAMLRRPEGATVDEIASAMGWAQRRCRVWRPSVSISLGNSILNPYPPSPMPRFWSSGRGSLAIAVTREVSPSTNSSRIRSPGIFGSQTQPLTVAQSTASI